MSRNNKSKKEIFMYIFVIFIIVGGVVFYFLYSNRPAEEEDKTPSWSEIIEDPEQSDYIKISEELINSEEKTEILQEEVSFPTKEIETDTLASGSYRDLDIKVRQDSVIEGEISFVNSLVDLGGHDLIFSPGSAVTIYETTFINAGANQADLDAAVYNQCVREQGEENCEKKENQEEPTGGLLVRTDQFEMSQSIIRESQGHGIYFYEAKNPIIANSQIYNNAWNGIKAESTQGLHLEENQIVNNGCFLYSEEFDRKIGMSSECKKQSIEFGSLYLNNIDDAAIGLNIISGDVIIRGQAKNLDFSNNTILTPSQLLVSSSLASGNISDNDIGYGDIMLAGEGMEKLFVTGNEVGGDIYYQEPLSGGNIQINTIKGKELQGGSLKTE